MAARMRCCAGENCISGPRVRSRWSAMRMRTIDHAACPNAKPVSTLAEHALRMERFAALIDALIYTRSRNGKLKLIADRSEEHTSELQSLMRISYAVFCLKKKTKKT